MLPTEWTVLNVSKASSVPMDAAKGVWYLLRPRPLEVHIWTKVKVAPGRSMSTRNRACSSVRDPTRAR